jgi:hypothetical protein
MSSLELEVGEVKGKMSGLENRMDNLETKTDANSVKLDTVLEKLSEARGGWKVITVVATVAAAFGTFASKYLLRIFG